jgi:hypothetical protein
MKKRYVFILCVICLVAGFFIGRKTVSYETEVRYVQGEVIRDTLYLPDPVYEVVPDTIYLIKHDTVQTLIDWNTERFYTWQPFNDERGVLDISASLQFNRLQDLSYTFVPIYKEITKYRVNVWQPYVGVSYSTFGIVGIGGGFFRNNFGVEYQYQMGQEGRMGHLVGVKWKF